jgi:hypothetical protein
MRAKPNFDAEMNTIVPHESLGADCCGCIVAVLRGDEADLVCNECNSLIRTMPTAEAEKTLCSSRFHMRSVARKVSALHSDERIPGFSAMNTFTCRECAEGVATEPTLQ